MGIVSYIYSNGKLSEKLRHIMIGLRLYYPYNIYYMSKMSRAVPVPQEMSDARLFFSSNLERVERIAGFLSDAKSKETFKKIVSLRQNYLKSDIPDYNYFDQYFPIDLPEFCRAGDDEIFLDCGSFTGDICVEYIKHVQSYKKIMAFEPDSRNIKELRKRRIDRLLVVEAACSDRNGTLFFCENNQSGGAMLQVIS